MSRPPAPPPSSAALPNSISSPSLGAPPIRMRHPLPPPPLHSAAAASTSSSSSSSASSSSSSIPRRNRSMKQHQQSHHHKSHYHGSSSSSSNERSPRFPTHHTNNNSSTSYTYASASPEFFAPTSHSTSPYYSSSHPSPASTTSSGAGSSSLRTPPDLLVNGSSAAALQVHGAKSSHHLAVNSWNGLVVKPRLPSRNMNADEIKRRKRLLSDLPNLPALELPSPPPSPKLRSKQASRDHVGSDRDDDRTSERGSSRKRARASPSPSPPPPSSRVILDRNPPTTVAPAAPRIIASATARHGSFTPSTLTSLAAAYRSAARELKHSADARASSLSASRPSYLAARPTDLSALQQLDAVLLFCYAFWLDDLAASSSCVAKNWISLFGLLRYATNAHSDLGNDVLLGVCRLVESAVLRKLHRHDSSLLQRKLSEGTITLEEVSKLVERQSADLERSDRLSNQARNLLSLPNLAASYPELLEKALASTTPNTEAAAKGLDPSKWPECGTFAFPLDSLSEVPHIVALGRCAVREHAKSRGVEYELVQMATS